MTKYPDQIATVKAFILAARADDAENPSWADMRAGYDGAGENMPIAAGVSVEDITLGGVAGLKLTPADAAPGRTLLYFHGGGYCIGSSLSHRSMVSEITKSLKATTYSMDYRMAPEAPFPAAVEDGLASYKALLDMGVAPDKLLISGDSAGGGLTLATTLSARDAGLPLPAGILPLSPWANLANEGASYATKAETEFIVELDGLNDMAGAYLGEASASNPLASPLMADLAGLPPMLIQVGSEEVLLSDSTVLAARAGEAKVPVTLEIWPDMPHVFQFFYPLLTDAQTAVARMGVWTEELLRA